MNKCRKEEDVAERRMFTKKVTDDDNFMALSSSAQALYLHLSMSADDDGFCNQVSLSMFKAHASVQDLQALLEKRYIYQFENGVIVIKHWRMANALRKDRYTPTVFQEELARLDLKENGSYTRLPNGCQTVAKRLPQDRIGEDRIVEDRIVEDRLVQYREEGGPSDDEPLPPPDNGTESEKVKPKGTTLNATERAIVDAYTEHCKKLPKIAKVTEARKKAIRAALRQYSLDELIKVFQTAGKSDFLTGKNDRGWRADFDWLMKPGNTVKVLEGTYDSHVGKSSNNRFHNFDQRNVNYDELLAGEFGRKRKKDN